MFHKGFLCSFRHRPLAADNTNRGKLLHPRALPIAPGRVAAVPADLGVSGSGPSCVRAVQGHLTVLCRA